MVVTTSCSKTMKKRDNRKVKTPNDGSPGLPPGTILASVGTHTPSSLSLTLSAHTSSEPPGCSLLLSYRAHLACQLSNSPRGNRSRAVPRSFWQGFSFKGSSVCTAHLARQLENSQLTGVRHSDQVSVGPAPGTQAELECVDQVMDLRYSTEDLVRL